MEKKLCKRNNAHHACHGVILPWLSRWHSLAHDNMKWYRRWHHYRFRPHLHWLLVFSSLLIGVGVIGRALLPSLPSPQAAAGILKEFPFQGRLTNSDGTVVADGNYDVVFKLYTVSSGGTASWTESHTGVNQVATTDGIFNVMLGSITGLGSIDFNTDTWYLGITVGSDTEMTPRIQLGAAPFAFNSDQLDGADATDFALLAGRSGGQTLIGGTGASDALNLYATSNATKGNLNLFGKNMVYTAQDITGAFYIDRASSSGRSQIALRNESSAEVWRFGMTGSGSTDFSFWDQTQNALVLEQNGDILLNPGGKIGFFGTPSGNFDVDFAGGTSNFGNTSGGNNVVWARSSGGSAGLWAGGSMGIVSTGAISFVPNQTYGAEDWTVKMRVKSSGDVIIADSASNPITSGLSEPLMVVAPNSNYGAAISGVADSVGRGFYFYTQDFNNSDTGGRVGFNITDGYGSLQVVKSGASANGDLALQSGGGNVGIGTVSPGQNLAGSTGDAAGTVAHVKDTSSLARTIWEGQLGAGFLAVDLGGGVDDKILNFSVGGGVAQFRSDKDDLTANKSNILTMDLGTGNVGIGTANPGELLHVAGAMSLTPGSAPATANEGDIYANSTDNNLYFYDGSSWVDLTASGSGSGDITAVGSMVSGDAFADATADNDWLGLGASAGRIEFDDQVTDEVNILNANVGIGTSTPSKMLHLYGTKPEVQIESTSGEAEVSLKEPAGTQWFMGTGWSGATYGADSLYFYDTTERLGIDTNGNIQVAGKLGVAVDPAYPLDVAGQVRFNQSGTPVTSPYAFSLQNIGSASTWFEILNNGGANKGAFFGITSNDFEIWNYQGGKIKFYTATVASSGTERMNVSTDGGLFMKGLASAPALQTGYAGIYGSGTTNTELYAIDDAGNTTLLSPHDNTTGEWIFYSKNIKTGRTVRINMEQLVDEVEKLSGKKFKFVEE